MKRNRVAAEQPTTEPDRPAGRSAADRIQAVVVLAAPYAQGAAGRIVPLARTAGGRVAPLAQTARHRGSRAAQEAVRAMGPRIDGAYVRLTPVLLSARGKVNEELVPRLSGAWEVASASPVVVEVTKRGRATLAAARGELSLPEVVASKERVWPTRLAVFAGAAGVGAVIAKKLLGTKDADWTAATSTADDVATASSPPAQGQDLPETADDQPAPSGGDPTAPDASSDSVSDSISDDEFPTQDPAADGTPVDKPLPSAPTP